MTSLFILVSLVAVFTSFIPLYVVIINRRITKTQLKYECNGSAKCDSLYILLRYEIVD